MGHWGVKSFENDDAADALDSGYSTVHGAAYDDLMDDANPLTPEAVHRKLAGVETLSSSLSALAAEVGAAPEGWDDAARLAYAGIVVQHAEFGVEIPDEVRLRALGYLRDEAIDWDEATARRLRREKEIRLLEAVH